MDQINILVTDDEREIADLLEIYLVSDGYRVWKAYSAKEGIQILQEHDIQLAILDIMMPEMDGIEMCRQIRKFSNIPVIFLSAKSVDLDKIHGEEIKLTPLEFDILCLLAQNPGKVFSTDEIFKNVWNETVYEANNTVMVHIRRLRTKIKDDNREDKIITTVWGVGYKIDQ